MDDTKKEVLAAGSGSGLGTTLRSNDSAAQRRRLLARLQQGALTTIQARRDLDIMMPAARVFELRRAGHEIVTLWTEESTDCGKVHRVALYVLRQRAANDDGGFPCQQLA